MPTKWFNKIFRSVFTKLLVVIVLAGICINLVVVGFFVHLRDAFVGPFHKNVVQYLNYLIADMGHPPTLERAREIARQSFLEIRYEGPDISWTTSEALPTDFKSRSAPWRPNPDIRFGKYRGRHVIEVNTETGRFIFAVSRHLPVERARQRLFVIMLVLLTLILTAAFFVIRHILRPVKWLNTGVQEVSRGNLKHRVPLKRSDELRDLAEAFNDMTDRIRDMLKSKEQLLLDVSHELRTPLTRMKVALEFLEDSQAKQSLQGDIEEMEKMVSEILETARRQHKYENLKKQPTNLAVLIQQTTAAFENQPPGVEIMDFPSEIEVKIDSEQIKTVFENVLNNAIKYSEAESNPVQVTCELHKSYAVIRIRDFGIGIPPEDRVHIFEPFYRVDKSRTKDTGGYGLGLSLCKTIMEAHGGKIEVQSTPQEGTTVSLYFPLTKT
ncbi:MAG: HAMP domain-containing histidine kinase [Deltaproteobacteria bacterium]|jgi:signal transduction histidine kinase|nr:HAMP domain-containing histidine kinase [Deltaproteobacteria bacterium]